MAGCLAVVFTMNFIGNEGDTGAALSSDFDLPDVEVEVSAVNSKVFPRNSVAEVGDIVDVNVFLFDLNGAPVSGHLVDLVPSSSDIEIYEEQDRTSDLGEAKFKVLSPTEDVVSISVYDASSNVLLSEDVELVFVDSYSNLFDSKFAMANSFGAVGNSSSSASSLEFEDVPNAINPGDAVNFKLAAYDDLDELVTDYTGEVRFSVVSGDEGFVTLPADYQFVATDLGEHTFSLALSFQQPGNYILEARDLENTSIYGNFNFEVTAGSSSSSDSANVVIESPVSGTYSNAVQVVTGKAPIGASLKIFDNDVELASVIVDVNGEFSYTTAALADGNHLIYVALVNQVGTIIASSSTVNLEIDTAAPELGEVVIEPSSTIGISDPVTIKFFSSEPLTQAAIVLNGSLYEMLDSGQGFYEVSFIAPDVPGEFPLSFVLVDQLGNETKYDEETTLTVGSTSNLSSIADVSGLTATAATNRVTLHWQAVENAKNYRVFYGVSPNELINAVDTFTDSTTWYIPSLMNGVEYYFAVVAVHENGNISEHFSNIVSSVPGGVVTVDIGVELGVEGEEALEDMESEVSETGPEIAWLLIFSLLAGYLYAKSSRKLCS